MTDSPSEVVAKRLRQLRRDRGWTAQRLADECAALGASQLTPSVIANIETGRKDSSGRRRREVTVEELLVFSYALNAPLPALLVPFTSEEMQVTPNTSLAPDAALMWLLAEAPPITKDGTVRDRETWRRHTNPITRYQDLWSLIEDLDEYWKLIDELTKDEVAKGPDPERTSQLQRLRDGLDRIVRAVGNHLSEMREQEIPLPVISPRLRADLERLSYLPKLGLNGEAGEQGGR